MPAPHRPMAPGIDWPQLIVSITTGFRCSRSLARSGVRIVCAPGRAVGVGAT